MGVQFDYFMGVFIFLITVLFFALVFFYFWFMFRDYIDTFRALWRRVRKCQFRLRTLFTGVSTFGVTMALLKSLDLLDSPSGAIALGCLALVPSLTVVLIVEIIFEDYFDLYFFRRKPPNDLIPIEPETTENGSDDLKIPSIQTIDASDQRTDQETLDI